MYNASAGSGKTFTLVKEYLKLLFISNNKDVYRNILALTFTNKAVGEMKTRIIDTLKEFSETDILEKPSSMFLAIAEELGTESLEIHAASRKILNRILHNYAAFDVSTIDRFTHKVIRTFAFDLKIPMNFEVELDTETLLSEAVDNLIAKAGTNKALTRVLVDFAIEKADDDKSWDISYDLNKIAGLLTNENDIVYLESFKDKTLEDFEALKKILKQRGNTIEKDIVSKAEHALKLIADQGLEHSDFRSAYLPKHFMKLANSRFDITFEAAWQMDIENSKLYPKRVSDEVANTIETIQPQLVSFFNETKALIFQLAFFRNFHKNITPLSVLNAINKELNAIKEDNNLLLISEFNNIIHKEIKNQPAPFIYERLGEKFKHYFIDEFQDTSRMQWDNLIPLIENRLASENGSAMLVGDAKQSIYRWRGGDPNIFMDLYNGVSRPFMTKQEINPLEHNYRSCRNIVEFNNSFFEHLSSVAFASSKHSELFSKAKQKPYVEHPGFVNIQFLEINMEDNRDELYTSSVKATIDACLENGFDLKDICVLVRKKREGVAIANYLIEQDIDIISSETLLLDSSAKVRFLTDVLRYTIQPKNKEVKAHMLYYLAESLPLEDGHGFLKNGLDEAPEELSRTLKNLGLDVDFSVIQNLSLYDAVEYIIRAFDLIRSSDAYVQYFLDVVLDYMIVHSSSISDFLSYWEKKRSKLSITIPEGRNAVQVMTIHKSKGLEFPVVIFPYADLNIYKEKEPKIWFPLEADKFNEFSFALLNYNKKIRELGNLAERLYDEHQAMLELDNINLLYVALTRPIEQLHVITKIPNTSKDKDNMQEYSGLFVSYLKQIGKWSDATSSYTFGTPEKQVHTKDPHENITMSSAFISNPCPLQIVTRSGYLWDTDQGKAIEKGNLVHDMLSRINTRKDIPFVLKDSLEDGIINLDQETQLSQLINAIVTHPRLEAYYSEDVLSYNERDVFSADGSVIRPDRLVLENNSAIIIDYKTGELHKKHEQQLLTYSGVIETMGIKVSKKILIYINDEITIKEV